jgi:hypothetical protein
MPWRKVVIRYADAKARNDAGNALIEKFGTLYRNTGVPGDVEVFHKSYHEKHVFYFSQNASEMAPELLSEFHSRPSADKPDLSSFRKIPL